MPAAVMDHDLDRLVDFLNSRYLPDDDDALADRRSGGWLEAWLAGRTPADAEPHPGSVADPDADALVRLRQVREGLREIAAANNGAQPDPATIDRAGTALFTLGLRIDLGDHTRAPELLAATATTRVEQALAAVAQSYLICRDGSAWRRVKACAAAECRYAFRDASRNNSRRWCDMAYCGNQAKARAWRARQSASGTGTVQD